MIILFDGVPGIKFLPLFCVVTQKEGATLEMLSKLALPGILFILTLAFGFWLSNTGRPYNAILFNIHKLIALGAVIYVCWQFSQFLKPTDFSATSIVLLFISALSTIALFASGGLMSAKMLDYTLMLTIHRVAPVILALSLALGIYWLMG